MLRAILLISVISAVVPGAALAQGQAQTASPPNLAGSYRCEPEPAQCQAGGQTFTVTQSGANLDLKNDKGNTGQGKLTSNISVSAGPPWNMLGTISSDARVIEWSNGTRWSKQ